MIEVCDLDSNEQNIDATLLDLLENSEAPGQWCDPEDEIGVADLKARMDLGDTSTLDTAILESRNQIKILLNARHQGNFSRTQLGGKESNDHNENRSRGKFSRKLRMETDLWSQSQSPRERAIRRVLATHGHRAGSVARRVARVKELDSDLENVVEYIFRHCASISKRCPS